MPGVFDLSSDESSSGAAEADLLTDPREPLPTGKPTKHPKSRGPSKQYKALICEIVLDCNLFYD
jgi:hypothetical protein